MKAGFSTNQDWQKEAEVVAQEGGEQKRGAALDKKDTG